MAVHARVLTIPPMFVASLRGTVTIADFVERIQKNAADPDFRPDLDRLIFLHRDLYISDAEFDTILAMKDKFMTEYFGAGVPNIGGAPLFRAATVTRPSAGGSIFRLLRAVMEINGLIVDHQSFDDLAPALDWLGATSLTAEDFSVELDGL